MPEEYWLWPEPGHRGIYKGKSRHRTHFTARRDHVSALGIRELPKCPVFRELYSHSKSFWNVPCVPKQTLILWHPESKKIIQKIGDLLFPFGFYLEACCHPSSSFLVSVGRHVGRRQPGKPGVVASQSHYSQSSAVALGLRASPGQGACQGANGNVRGWNFHSWLCHKPKTVQKSLVVLIPVFRMALSWP